MGQELEEIHTIAMARRGLGECAERAGDVAGARAAYEEALVAFQRFDHPVDRARVELGLGRLRCCEGDLSAGRAVIDAALKMLQERSYVRARAEQARRAGRFFLGLGDAEAARYYLELARQSFEQLDHHGELDAIAVLLASCKG